MMNSYAGERMPLLILVLILLWTLFWKGYAIWTAVKKDQKPWFVVLLVVNTFGILEIIYIFCVAKKKWSDVKEVLSNIFTFKKRTKKEETPKEETKQEVK